MSEYDWEGFNVEEPEDLFAIEEMYYGMVSKCKGKKRKEKFKVKE